MTLPKKKSPPRVPASEKSAKKFAAPSLNLKKTASKHASKAPASAGSETSEPRRPRTLKECRNQIDAVDKAIIDLLDRRAEVARRVGELKAASGDDFFDAGRHLQVLNGIAQRGSGSFPPEGLRDVFGEILSVCLNLQSPQTIAFLGPEATNTHIAARRAFGRSPRFISYLSISDIFLAVEKLWAHYGVVPIENSTGGVIHATLDELMSSNLSICAELYVPIRHSLLCKGKREKIKKICTHPQILMQCRVWLRENMPGVPTEEVPSSAEGAKLARKDPSIATIATQMAAEIYELPVLEQGIEDQKDNITRFLVIGHQSPRPSGHDRTSIMFSIKDEPGALYHLLKPFSDKRINMTKIESRPTRLRAWDYIFFVDIEGHISQPEIVRVVDDLRKHCTQLRVLGSYPIDRHPALRAR
jgi:chorismate mutase/prephenate dehydratase